MVTVTGRMDAKELAPYLKEKLRRSVEVIPAAKKDDKGGEKNEKEGDKGGDRKDKDGGGDKKEKENGGGSDKKEKKSGGGEKEKEGDSKAAIAGGDGAKSVESKVEVNKMEHYGYNPNTYTMPMYHQNYAIRDYVGPSHHYNQDYSNHGYVAEYSHPPPPPPPPQPIYFQDPHGHQIFSDENPNACSVM